MENLKGKNHSADLDEDRKTLKSVLNKVFGYELD
jgi:hypothetical protein